MGRGTYTVNTLCMFCSFRFYFAVFEANIRFGGKIKFEFLNVDALIIYTQT